MHKGRLEAFSDGVFAVLITIMVLELKVPDGANWAALQPLLPVFLTYVLSFVFLGIYWNNHHHLMHMVDRVNGGIMWANLHLLFWLSLIPFVTAWMGGHGRDQWPAAIYGVVMTMAGFAYFVLVRLIIADQLNHSHGKESKLADAIGNDAKGIGSLVIYVLAIVLAFVNPILADVLYVGVALMWLVPDRRITRRLGD